MKPYIADLAALICVAVFSWHYTDSAWTSVAAVLFVAVYGAWNFYDGITRQNRVRRIGGMK